MSLNLGYAVSKARIVRRFFNLEPRFEPEEFVRQLGFEYVVGDYEDNPAWVFIKQGKVAIFVNRGMPPVTNRWDVCHETGHILLGHFGSRSCLTTRLQEIESNAFAEELLMPREEFLEACSFCKDMREVAQKFGTSLQASYFRVDNLLKNHVLLDVPKVALEPPGWAKVSYAARRA